MLRAAFDTNVLVSSLIGTGKPRELWNAVLEARIRLVTSMELLSEFSEVIARPKFRRYMKRAHSRKFERTLKRKATICRIKTHLPQMTEDPDDNLVLEAAHAGRVDYIVSGDRDLLKLEEFKGIKIVTVNRMLEILHSGPG